MMTAMECFFSAKRRGVVVCVFVSLDVVRGEGRQKGVEVLISRMK